MKYWQVPGHHFILGVQKHLVYAQLHQQHQQQWQQWQQWQQQHQQHQQWS
jgi:hypothetical protein